MTQTIFACTDCGSVHASSSRRKLEERFEECPVCGNSGDGFGPWFSGVHL